MKYSTRTSGIAALVAAIAASASLAACGMSSARREANRGKHGARRNNVNACLKEHGVTLGREKLAGVWLNGGIASPSGIPVSRLGAVLRLCGDASLQVAGTPVMEALQVTIARLAGCLRAQGVRIIGPDFTGRGPAIRITRPRRLPKSIETRCVDSGLVALGYRSNQTSVIKVGN
jgi:hypothetical protein